MREVFVPRFEQAAGAKLTLYAGWWDGMPKLKAARESDPPFDLMITDATQGYPAAREGLFATLDLTRIPNHKTLAPASCVTAGVGSIGIFAAVWVMRGR